MIQGDISVRFFDKQQKRIGALAAPDAPSFTELDIFKIPADAEFDPTEPFRLQLLVQRAVGAVEKTFLTFDLGYTLPERFLRAAARSHRVAGRGRRRRGSRQGRAVATHLAATGRSKSRCLAVMLLALTGIFFFQFQATANPRVFYWVPDVVPDDEPGVHRLVCQCAAFGGQPDGAGRVACASGFTWDAFLMDPLVFILWFALPPRCCSGGGAPIAAGCARSGRCRN